jgi:hypothetical protein
MAWGAYKKPKKNSVFIRSGKEKDAYTRTPLLNSFLGSWTMPLMVTFSMLKTERTVAPKMYMIACAIWFPGHALRGEEEGGST